MAKNKKPGYKLVVKNGDYRYKLNKKTGQYGYEATDLVEGHETLESALREFLSYVDDDYNSETVTLTFTPKKKKDLY